MRMERKYILILAAVVLLTLFFWPKPNGVWDDDATANLADKAYYKNTACTCIGFAMPEKDCKSCTQVTDCFGVPVLCNSYCRQKTNEIWDYAPCEKFSVNLTNVSSNFSYPTNKTSCEAQGGNWGPIGLSPQEVCVLPTTDAGKSCSDSSECQAACVAELTEGQRAALLLNHTPVRTTGRCTAWKTSVGCNAYVENGVVNGIMCVD
jgi:hypothetical protein